jgi:glycosyltransferase involved in cell wall biosynthesis
MNKVKLLWAAQLKSTGNAYGYSTQGYRMLEALRARGDVEISETFQPGADIAVHVITPDQFQPIAGVKNLLFCLAPETRVIKSDLTWVPVRDLSVGDELIAFDETFTRQNSYRRSTVVGTSRQRGPGFRIKTTRGEITASANHRWVVIGPHGHDRIWKSTSQLREGWEIVRGYNFDPWEVDRSYDAGWLAGFMDGEGFCSKTARHVSVGFAQNAGPTLDRALGLLDRFGFTYNITKNNNRKYPEKDHCSVQIHKPLRLFGMIRPSRLMHAASRVWDGIRTFSPYSRIDPAVILSVEPVGEIELIGTATTTGTLIAEGFFSHNTMYEATEIPPQWVEPINMADVLVVPCRQNQTIFQPHFRGGHVERCRLGVDPLQFPYVQRGRSPHQPFRFLWVGAPNPRKGFQLALGAWTLWLRSGRMPHDVELYMKSSGTEEDRVTRFKAALQMRGKDVPMPDNPADRARALMEGRAAFDFFDEKDVSAQAPTHPCVIFDTRDYSADQMRQLYHGAHAFVLPSVGEGWGLTLCEALATGAPSIWTHWSGPCDFADESTGFPVTKWSLGPLQMMAGKKNKETGAWEISVSHNSYGAIAHADALVKRFEQIYHGYPAALARGKKAADRIHARYKWSDCAEEFMQIVRRHI